MSKLINTLKDMDKGKLFMLIGMFGIGVLLLILSNIPFGSTTSDDEEPQQMPSSQDQSLNYEQSLTKELESILALIDGAGEVRVMLTLSHGSELQLAVDSSKKETITEESDDNNTQRSVSDTSSDDKTVLVKQSDGSDKPVILLEQMPRVEGAIIVAKGGGDIFVKDALIKATQTVLGVEPHKVQVLKMK